MSFGQTSNCFIEHPASIPVDISLAPPPINQPLSKLEKPRTGITVPSDEYYTLGSFVKICVAAGDEIHFFVGEVAWIDQDQRGQRLGLVFHSRQEAYRARMIEQLCHIYAYRLQMSQAVGNQVAIEEAARHWIAKYSDSFPQLLACA